VQFYVLFEQQGKGLRREDLNWDSQKIASFISFFIGIISQIFCCIDADPSPELCQMIPANGV